MGERNFLFVMLIVSELFISIEPSERLRQNTGKADLEVEMDTVQHDITKIWNHLDSMKPSCLMDCEVSCRSTEKQVTDASLQNKEVKRLFSAFQDEKHAVHNILDNITSVISGQEKKIKTLEKDVESYKKSMEDKDKEVEELKSKISHLEVITEEMFKNLSIALTVCRPMWHQYMGSCYFFSTIKSNWTEAGKKCEQEGANLVEYNSAEEVKFVLDLVLSIEPPWSQFTYAGFWAGASDVDKDGEWVWSTSGKKVDTGFTNWYGNQPDNYRGIEDCLMSCINLEGKWNDGSCEFEKKYVCEKDLSF